MNQQHLQYYLQSVYEHIHQNELREAQSVLEEMMASYPNDLTWEVYHIGGVVKWLSSDLEGAEREFKRSLSMNTSQAFVHNNLGNVFYAQKRIEDAILSYKRALDLDGNYAQAHSHLGLCYGVLKDIESAQRHHQKGERAGTAGNFG